MTEKDKQICPVCDEPVGDDRVSLQAVRQQSPHNVELSLHPTCWQDASTEWTIPSEERIDI